ARDWKKPYKTDGDRMVRQIVNNVMHRAGPDDQIVVLDENAYIGASFEWYLRQQGDRIRWNGEVDWDRLLNCGDLWGLSVDRDCASRAACKARVSQRAWFLWPAERENHDLQLGQTEETLEHCEVFHWKRLLGRDSGNRVLFISPSVQMTNSTRSGP